MKPASEVTALVVDSGIFHEIASKLGETFRKVYYCVPSWAAAYPSMNLGYIGWGLDNIEVVDSPFRVLDQCDLAVFPDVHFGPMQAALEKQGLKVWGSRNGEECELSRVAMKEHMAELGLDVNTYAVVHGMDALRAYLKDHPGSWVKVDKYRATLETFQCKTYRQVEPKLAEIEYKLGPFGKIVDFLVEEDLPDDEYCEIGCDAWTVDGQYPKSILAGIEIKGCGLVGVFRDYADLPEPLTRFNKAIAPTLKKYGYRGFFSTENRINSKGDAYQLDFCARAASPPNELYQEFYENFADIVWQGANGIMVDPVPVAKYGAEAIIHSRWAAENWQPIDFPQELKRFVKLRNATKIGGRYWIIPQEGGGTGIGAVTGWGATLKEAQDAVREHAKEVEGYFVDIDIESLDKGTEEVEKCAKFGLSMF